MASRFICDTICDLCGESDSESDRFFRVYDEKRDFMMDICLECWCELGDEDKAKQTGQYVLKEETI